MSYTPEDQRIDKPIRDLLEAIDRLNEPINKRIEDSDLWAATHKKDLIELQKTLLDLKLALVFLQ